MRLIRYHDLTFVGEGRIVAETPTVTTTVHCNRIYNGGTVEVPVAIRYQVGVRRINYTGVASVTTEADIYVAGAVVIELQVGGSAVDVISVVAGNRYVGTGALHK